MTLCLAMQRSRRLSATQSQENLEVFGQHSDISSTHLIATSRVLRRKFRRTQFFQHVRPAPVSTDREGGQIPGRRNQAKALRFAYWRHRFSFEAMTGSASRLTPDSVPVIRAMISAELYSYYRFNEIFDIITGRSRQASHTAIALQ